MSPIERQQYWYDMAHSAIDSGYSSAIANYKQQKNNFLKMLGMELEEGGKQFLKEVQDEIEKQTEEKMSEKFDEAFSKIQSKVEEKLAIAIENGSTNWNELTEKFKESVKRANNNKQKGDVKSLYNNYKKRIGDFLNSNDMKIDKLGLAQLVGEGGNNSNIQDQLFGYARKVIFNKLRNSDEKIGTSNFKNSLSGYYREEALVQAFNEVMNKYGMSARRTAGEKVNNKEIKYDAILGTVLASNVDGSELQSYIDALDHFNASGSSTIVYEDLEIKGAIQSKSWVTPWSKNKKPGMNSSFLKIGYSSALRPAGVDKHYWHAGLYNVMSNLTSALGLSNFIYATGDSLYFTADLLTEFKEAQYVFAFGWLKNGGTRGKGEIADYIIASKHLDS